MTSTYLSSWLRSAATLAAATALVCAACATSEPPDEGLEGVALSSVAPDAIVPGSLIVVHGTSFVGEQWGTTVLRLSGAYADAAGTRDVDVRAPARFIDFDELAVDADSAMFDAFGADGDFAGVATVEVSSAVDGELYVTNEVTVNLAVRSELTPALDTVQTGGVIFVNDEVFVMGTDFLLGGGEGTTYATVEGCFTPESGGPCAGVGPVDVPVTPESAFDRTRGTFAFAPDIAGIRPGTFDGTVLLTNRHDGGGGTLTSSALPATYEMLRSTVFSVSTGGASLGQFVDIVGGGFVGGVPGASTLIQLSGTYTPEGAPQGGPVDLLLVPEYVDGRLVRYVLNEDDSLGQALDLRRDTGTFVGDLTPVVSFGGDEVTGDPATFTLSIEPVKQVVFLDFKPSYVESLRHFGLRGADTFIRDRVVDAVNKVYTTTNLDIRIVEPTDFALFSVLEISGPDPNGLGLFGYDNSPGKDTNNERLYDRIGGVNAETQDDGYPGYGGVFIESLFGFSPNPGGYAESLSGADEAFDAIFDAFRPDRGGERVAAADLSGGVDMLANGDGCPATTRQGEVACAVFVIGGLIGTTVSHEIGHSLGLANPFSEGFHNVGDMPNRLMDTGGSRPFMERAELFGQGPAIFCQEEYEYLRSILPTSEPEDLTVRPSCF
jgi:hypothetical protein